MYAYLCKALILAGSILMAYNIYRYVRYAQTLLHRDGWEHERRTLLFPILLLVCFLMGYLFVGTLGDPGPVVAGILLGGSIFVYCMISFLMHITGRIEENEHLAAQLAAAEEASRAKSSFLSTMSHEIRTPLNAIIGLNAISLQEEGLAPTLRDRLEKVDGSARHLLALINNILDMSRIEAGQMVLAAEPFSLRDLQSHVCTVIDSQCTAKGLTYRCEIVGSPDTRYRGDITKLSQVLINILGNSVKFTEAPGIVSLHVEQVPSSDTGMNTLRFTLSDTGVGMDEEFIPKLFGTFTQEHSSTTSSYGGSGLGMAITKRIVELMDGTIDVQSQKGVGTTVVVTVKLPLCEEQAEEDASASSGHDTNAPDADISLAGRHVLIAEDMDINAEILGAVLEMRGISHERAYNGRQAVDLFDESAEGHFDAVLMDVRMPVMDGLSAARAIRSLERRDSSRVPIVALTANAFDDDVRQSLDAGMDAHLSKPIDPDLLYDTLCRLLG